MSAPKRITRPWGRWTLLLMGMCKLPYSNRQYSDDDSLKLWKQGLSPLQAYDRLPRKPPAGA